MLIKIDNREKELIKLFENSILPPEVSYSIETLNLGDIIIENEGNELVLFERKTLNDLASSIKDKRYIEQSMRLQHYKPFHNHNIIYLIEGCFKFYNNTYTRIHINTLISAMTTLHYIKGFSVMKTTSLQETYDFIIGYACKLEKEKTKEPYYKIEEKTIPTESNYVSTIKCHKKDNITPDNISAIMLSQIPGVSMIYAEGILENFKNIQDFISKLHSNNDILKHIRYTTKTGNKRAIPQSCISNIKKYLLDESTPLIDLSS
jgi:ERCC4-type nuclease